MSDHSVNLITLRIGVFFDGTANNTYSATWGKREYEQYQPQWHQRYDDDAHKPGEYADAEHNKYQVTQLSSACYAAPDQVASSAANEVTNIEKLYEQYAHHQFNRDKTCYYLAQYITGIGTGNRETIAPAHEQPITEGIGLGPNGVIGKALYAISQITEQYRDVMAALKEDVTIDGIDQIALDVFGFSRGAAAARHFINQLCAAENNTLKGVFFSGINDVNRELGIDYQMETDDLTITFAGLFDTVAAIFDPLNGDWSAHNNNNGDVKLWLDPARVTCAVHLTANDHTEYRCNFSVNRLNHSDHFYELIGPGAHSDIGGGYFSKCSYGDDNYLLPRLEKQLVKRVKRSIHNTSYHNQTMLEQQIQRELIQARDKERLTGWDLKDYEQPPIQVKEVTNTQRDLIGELYIKRVVEGDLSRLYLRIMFGLALYHGVPLSENSPQGGGSVWSHPYFRVSEEFASRDGALCAFGQLCDAMLTLAKQGEVAAIQSRLNDANVMQELMRMHLIHHSSADSVANHPHEQDRHYQRSRYETAPNQ